MIGWRDALLLDDPPYRACGDCNGEGGYEVSDQSWDDPYGVRWEECAECGGGGYVEDDGLTEDDEWSGD